VEDDTKDIGIGEMGQLNFETKKELPTVNASSSDVPVLLSPEAPALAWP
jgi:hypothetical protein